MRLTHILLAAALTAGLATPAHADIRDILTGLGQAAAGQQQQQQQPAEQQPAEQQQQQQGGGGLGSLLGGLLGGGNQGGGIVDQISSIGSALGIIPEKTVDAAYLNGVWNYAKPAVAFKSENFLMNAGGVAASAKIEGELEPYYNRLGLNKLAMTFWPDQTFSMAVGKMTLNGNYETDPEAGTATFHFTVLGKVSLGSMAAFITGESNNQMTITFDVSKLLSIVKAISGIAGNSTIGTLGNLVAQYDGLTLGFQLNRSSATPPAK